MATNLESDHARFPSNEAQRCQSDATGGKDRKSSQSPDFRPPPGGSRPCKFAISGVHSLRCSPRPQVSLPIQSGTELRGSADRPAGPRRGSAAGSRRAVLTAWTRAHHARPHSWAHHNAGHVGERGIDDRAGQRGHVTRRWRGQERPARVAPVRRWPTRPWTLSPARWMHAMDAVATPSTSRKPWVVMEINGVRAAG